MFILAIFATLFTFVGFLNGLLQGDFLLASLFAILTAINLNSVKNLLD